MTTQDNPSASREEVAAAWLAHKRIRGSPPKSVPTRFETDCIISYVPLGVVYRGHREIEGLFEQMRLSWSLVEDTKVLTTIYGENSDVFEESIVSLRHEGSIDYLLPGIKSTGRTLQVAMQTVSTFRGDKLLRQRVYWDHASLLRQAGLLPQTARVRSGAEVQIKVAGQQVTEAILSALPDNGDSNANTGTSQEDRPIHTASPRDEQQNRPIQTRATSQSFQDEEALPGNDRKSAVAAPASSTPDPYGGAEISVANRSNPVTGGRQSVRLFAPPGGVSQIGFGSSNVSTPPRATTSAFDEQPVGQRSAQRLDEGVSQDTPTPAASTTSASTATPDPYGGAEISVANRSNPVTGGRQSVRLFAPPGGVSQIGFGTQHQSTDTYQRQTPRAVTSASQDTPYGHQDASPVPQAPTNQAARNNYAARDRGTLGFGQDAGASPTTVHSGRRSFADVKDGGAGASMSGAGGAPPVTGDRVSVRLHAPPGGKSQISFG
ncbi:hypothetical protein HKX48_003532 [Thoreauomyces humboldtii]|nr:hypothetical protein HKX48_003532 [Thoreauomyces humboldtii]